MRSPVSFASRGRRVLGVLCALCVLGVFGTAGAPAASAQNCANTSVGFDALPDLGPRTYQGFQGGLYPGGLNVRPPLHDQAGLQFAAGVLPRDAAGVPNPAGKIVLLSIGMSNATQEFSTFIQLASQQPGLNPALVLVDGAQGGQTAAIISNPAANFWQVVSQRLAQKGVTQNQVAAIWLKEADASPTAGFPQHAQTLQGEYVAIAQILNQTFPNARLCYMSSRSYGGYATTALNPEPYAYESGFAVKWTIEQQIGGSPALNYNPAQGPVTAPWLAWGPYLWADGLLGRADTLTWTCADVQADGTHPAGPGRSKVADLLLDFFSTDATAKGWFLANPGLNCGPQALAQLYGPAVFGAQGEPTLALGGTPTVPTLKPLNVRAFHAPASMLGAYLVGFDAIAPGQVPFLGGSLLVTPDFVLPVFTNAAGQSDLPLAPVPAAPSLCGESLHFQFIVADATAPAGYGVTRGLRVRFGH